MGIYDRFLLQDSVILSIVVESTETFPFSNRVIDRSLSAMNGCNGQGGKTLNFR